MKCTCDRPGLHWNSVRGICEVCGSQIPPSIDCLKKMPADKALRIAANILLCNRNELTLAFNAAK